MDPYAYLFVTAVTDDNVIPQLSKLSFGATRIRFAAIVEGPYEVLVAVDSAKALGALDLMVGPLRTAGAAGFETAVCVRDPLIPFSWPKSYAPRAEEFSAFIQLQVDYSTTSPPDVAAALAGINANVAVVRVVGAFDLFAELDNTSFNRLLDDVKQVYGVSGASVRSVALSNYRNLGRFFWHG